MVLSTFYPANAVVAILSSAVVSNTLAPKGAMNVCKNVLFVFIFIFKPLLNLLPLWRVDSPNMFIVKGPKRLLIALFRFYYQTPHWRVQHVVVCSILFSLLFVVLISIS